MPDYSDPSETMQNVCTELSNQDETIGSTVGDPEYRSVATDMYCPDAGTPQLSNDGGDYSSVELETSDAGSDPGYDVYQSLDAGYDASSTLDGGVDIDINVDYGSMDAGY
jgi:hypothetical protein